ncbi:MAG TPA: HAD family phosphatase [Steroidobacteraceae bacterium]
MPAPFAVRVLLFDVGGVLVELRGVEIILAWLGNRLTAEQLWHRWLQSDAVRGFETGRIDAPQFAAGVIEEFQLDVDPQAFLDSFIGWPTGLFPGTLELLQRIPRRYQRALLSNSNPLHWPRVLDQMHLGPAIEHHFVSHLTGHIKPDPEAFEHVLQTLGCSAPEVAFFDDNALNIDTARALGMQARHVRGLAETHQALIELGVLDCASFSVVSER